MSLRVLIADDQRLVRAGCSRELEVFRLVARGLSNREVADQVFVGETTVKTHVTRIPSKLGLWDRVQVVVLAYETGIATPGTTSDNAHS